MCIDIKVSVFQTVGKKNNIHHCMYVKGVDVPKPEPAIGTRTHTHTKKRHNSLPVNEHDAIHKAHKKFREMMVDL